MVIDFSQPSTLSYPSRWSQAKVDLPSAELRQKTFDRMK